MRGRLDVGSVVNGCLTVEPTVEGIHDRLAIDAGEEDSLETR